MKKLILSPAVEREFKDLPQAVKQKFTLDLHAICKDSKPFSKAKTLSAIGPGVIQLSINGRPAFRCIYVAKSKDFVHVLSYFKKTTNGVDKPAMKLAEERYKDIKK